MLLTTFEIYMTSFLEAMIECHLHSFVCFNFLTASCIKWDLRSRPGIEPLILVLDHWKCRVLTTELPGMLLYCFLNVKKKKKFTVNCLKFTMYEVTFFMLWLLALPKYKFVCLGTSRNMRGCGSLQGDH